MIPMMTPIVLADAVASGSATVTMTATVTEINKTDRTITLRDDSGNTRTFKVGDAVKRFDNMQVGDKVTFAYQESIALSIAKPGTAAMPATSPSPVITQYAGNKPGGSISQTQTAVVVIKAIDMSKPSVTVQMPDGHLETMAVSDKNNLTGFKAGDSVQITYSQALMIEVK